MTIDLPTALLGGLSPQAFMRRYWQKKPLLVRQAWPGVTPPVTRAEMFALAAHDDVESRLLVNGGGDAWRLRHGPMARRSLPPLTQPRWTLLVQGLDLHVAAANQMLERFAFVPRARLDDLMLSFATDGGGVGPHVDSYDVFLLQVHGHRRWRVAPPADESFLPGLPLKILSSFNPTLDCVLAPGDMLYLPPGWGHDGVAQGECMTASVGFRTPRPSEMAADLLQRLADACEPDDSEPRYADPAQTATARSGEVPQRLADFAQRVLAKALREPGAVACALGESLTEPKAQVVFDLGSEINFSKGLHLDRRSKMLYDARHVFINGEAFRAGGRDARLLQQLADQRFLSAPASAKLSAEAADTLQGWAEAGWLHEGV